MPRPRTPDGATGAPLGADTAKVAGVMVGVALVVLVVLNRGVGPVIIPS